MKFDLIQVGPIPEWSVIDCYHYHKYKICFEVTIYKAILLKVCYVEGHPDVEWYQALDVPVNWCCGHNKVLRTLMFLFVLNAIDNNDFDNLPPDSMVKPVDLDQEFMTVFYDKIGSYKNLIILDDLKNVKQHVV